MKYRQAVIQDTVTLTDNKTDTYDINIQDPISSIILGFEFSKTATIPQLHPMASITKIEIVDGSDVLFSLDGYEAEALDWYNNGGKLRSNYDMYLSTNGPSRFVGINFGRYLWDPEYAFDPKMFTNPQLRITLDIDAWAASGNYIYLTAWANLFDEAPVSLKGFLMSKEIKQYTMASTVHEYTDLPTDHPYEGIYFRPYLLGTEPNAAVSNIKISEDQDKKIPFDLGGQDIVRTLLAEYPEIAETAFVDITVATKYFYCMATTRVTAVGAPWKALAVDGGDTFYNGDGGRLDMIAKATSGNCQIHVRGFVPHCVYKLPCGIHNDPSTYWDVRNIGSLRADITGGAAAQGFIFLQQLRPY
ncbi:hypothetical protein LCGC14_2753360 [marine sediment metagenome]|uniref:Uncharacterized protein n=1 Tax=marine sediment metagenome TaxID=412755 RepID=A0A0F9BSV5_9ZZZZ